MATAGKSKVVEGQHGWRPAGQHPPVEAASSAGCCASAGKMFCCMNSPASPAGVDLTLPLKAYGPFLRFGGYDSQSNNYYASVLVVAHVSKGAVAPTLKYRDVAVRGSDVEVKAQLLLLYCDFNVWRFDVTIVCGVPERTFEYRLKHDKDMFYQQKNIFRVPGTSQKWRWGFYSCNGFHDHQQEADMGGIEPLWRDVNLCNEEKPIHVMIGGGDQVYCDDVWSRASLVQWLAIPDKAKRLGHAFTKEMSDQVQWFYFAHYIRHWTQPRFKEALATIPQIMMWDDHDIFDGWGSYPAELQACPVFQGVYSFARKFFCLFQLHSTPEHIHDQNQVFGELGWNWLGCLGSTTAVLMLDARAERAIDTCVRPASWVMIQQRLAALPKTVQHVVVLAPVPVVYPQVSLLESGLNLLEGKGAGQQAWAALMQKTGLYRHIYNQFGLPDLLDDLADHWSAGAHAAEKLTMLHMLQKLAQARGFRFTFLSGDVHVAALGRFCTHPNTDPKKDHRYMAQIISSAIGNAPPPAAVVKLLSSNAKVGILDQHTEEKLVKAFDDDEVLKGARNWCLVREDLLVEGDAMRSGAMTFQLRVEDPAKRGQRPAVFEMVVPVLDIGTGLYMVNKTKPLPMPSPPPLDMFGQQQLKNAAHVENTGATPPGLVPH